MCLETLQVQVSVLLLKKGLFLYKPKVFVLRALQSAQRVTRLC